MNTAPNYQRLPLFCALRLSVPRRHWLKILAPLLGALAVALLFDHYFSQVKKTAGGNLATVMVLVLYFNSPARLRALFLHRCLSSAPQLQLVLVPGATEPDGDYHYPLQDCAGRWQDFQLSPAQIQPWRVGDRWLAVAFPDRDCGYLLAADLANVQLDPEAKARLQADIDRLLAAPQP